MPRVCTFIPNPIYVYIVELVCICRSIRLFYARYNAVHCTITSNYLKICNQDQRVDSMHFIGMHIVKQSSTFCWVALYVRSFITCRIDGDRNDDESALNLTENAVCVCL